MQILKTTHVKRVNYTGGEWMCWEYHRNAHSPVGLRVTARWLAVEGRLELRQIRGDGRKPNFQVYTETTVDDVANLIDALRIAETWATDVAVDLRR